MISAKSIPVLSLFSGGGLLDIGFIDGGFNVVDCVELDERFISVYNHAIGAWLSTSGSSKIRKPTSPLITRAIDASSPIEQRSLGRSYSRVAGLIGGPPCQDYSIAGLNGGVKGTRGRLINSYCDIVDRVKPDFLFFENVDGLVHTKKHKSSFRALVKRLEQSGYRVYYKVTNALEYGVPQDRDRLTLVAFRKRIVSALVKAGFADDVGVRTDDREPVFAWPVLPYVGAREQPWPKTSKFRGNAEFLTADRVEQRFHRLRVVSAWEGLTDASPNQLEYFNPKSARFLSTPEGYVSQKSFKRLHRYRYSPTVAYGNNEVHLHPTEARRISVREALRLQSVPDGYIMPPEAALSVKFKIIGNGVPTLKAGMIASEIRRTMENFYAIK